MSQRLNCTEGESLRNTLNALYRADEAQCLETLADEARVSSAQLLTIRQTAQSLIARMRHSQRGTGGVDALLNEFSLSSEEGVVLMCLAEALLRVPDTITVDRLIRDKLLQGNWSSHLGNSHSMFVNASSWGLLLTGKVIELGSNGEKKNLLKTTVSRLGEPVIRAAIRYAMQLMGTQFVMGKSIDSAITRAVKQESKGYRYSYDMLGEGARTQEAADRYYNSYRAAIVAIGEASKGRGPISSAGISVKLSAIHPRYEMTHRQRVMDELVPRLKSLALVAKQYDIGFTVDAEEADRLELSMDVIEAVFSDGDLGDWQGFGLAIQAYQKRALTVVDWVAALAKKHQRKMMVRLVKGAYWDSEIKWCQEQGLSDYPVFTRKPSTDVSYHACAKRLLANRDFIYPQFATHNAYTVSTILSMDDVCNFASREGYEFQRLHGMGDSLYDQILTDEQVACRIYAPVGEHEDLLAYLVRRLLENGANTSFVNNIIDEKITLESLLQDPVATVMEWTQKSNVHIPLPKYLYAQSAHENTTRMNATGWDLSNRWESNGLLDDMDNAWSSYQAAQESKPCETDSLNVVNPANGADTLGRLSLASEDAMKAALEETHNALKQWSSTDVNARAQILRTIAVQLEENTPLLLSLCVKEAGKTVDDSVAEIREAVDFCRYYADRGEELMEHYTEITGSSCKAKGVVLCISPWNFPVAIFLGQISAALVCGNTVIAKPAEQTSLVAVAVVDILYAAGLPKQVLKCLPARGALAGEVLVPDERVKAVMFTGSTDTARRIHRSLAKRSDAAIALIAETGGQNAMIVDSTALPEQVVDDVIQSGFQSAGQRCSALRVLFLQEDVADKIIDMIKGAMDELTIGDPAFISTDVGPVIDAAAKSRLVKHIDGLSTAKGNRVVHRCEIPSDGSIKDDANFFAPHLLEISGLDQLTQEVFGPVVHIIRFSAKNIDAVVEQINSSGFGLTLGVHSRIKSFTDSVCERATVGNVYVNRNMIGAIVGVQPFGGRGLSGTGPKAGGPDYLTRLVDDASGLPWQDFSIPSLDMAQAQLIDLPGPTGESNRLTHEPKGDFILIDGDIATCEDSSEASKNDADQNVPRVQSRISLRKALLALACGNRVSWFTDQVIAETEKWLSLELTKRGYAKDQIPVHPLNEWSEHINSETMAGVIINPQHTLAKAIEQTLAEGEGALISLVTEDSDRLLLPRLRWEKTISEDTTANGGNTSLMTMAP